MCGAGTPPLALILKISFDDMDGVNEYLHRYPVEEFLDALPLGLCVEHKQVKITGRVPTSSNDGSTDDNP
jgi:hypothetical protein